MTKEDQILKIAEEEFVRNGFLSTSMVTVAKRAGVTHAMVNYYFRSKEQLFLQILDVHVMRFYDSIKHAMKADGDFVENVVQASNALFDALDKDRDFPFLIQDVIRTSPEIIERYREMLSVSFTDSYKHHSERLAVEIASGRMSDTSLSGILETVFSLTVSPFMMIPALENLCGHSQEEIEDYLTRRREETERIIKAIYIKRK